MKDSLKKFYEYADSENELLKYVRLNGEWNEELFYEMRRLVREVINDYDKEKGYPKKFIYYFMATIPSIIDMLSQMKDSSEVPRGYTQESYANMLSEKMKLLYELGREIRRSLQDFIGYKSLTRLHIYENSFEP